MKLERAVFTFGTKTTKSIVIIIRKRFNSVWSSHSDKLGRLCQCPWGMARCPYWISAIGVLVEAVTEIVVLDNSHVEVSSLVVTNCLPVVGQLQVDILCHRSLQTPTSVWVMWVSSVTEYCVWVLWVVWVSTVRKSAMKSWRYCQDLLDGRTQLPVTPAKHHINVILSI